MPTMWLIKDGRTPYTECGPGVPLGFDDAVALFGTEVIRYLGPEPPSLNPDEPSEDPVNVVVQVDGGEGTNTLLPQPGFYWAVSVSPAVAVERLHEHQRRR